MTDHSYILLAVKVKGGIEEALDTPTNDIVRVIEQIKDVKSTTVLNTIPAPSE